MGPIATRPPLPTRSMARFSAFSRSIFPWPASAVTARASIRTRGRVASLFPATTRMSWLAARLTAQYVGRGKKPLCQRAATLWTNRHGCGRAKQDLHSLPAHGAMVLVDWHRISFSNSLDSIVLPTRASLGLFAVGAAAAGVYAAGHQPLRCQPAIRGHVPWACDSPP
jgi:hypothetical protein